MNVQIGFVPILDKESVRALEVIVQVNGQSVIRQSVGIEEAGINPERDYYLRVAALSNFSLPA